MTNNFRRPCPAPCALVLPGEHILTRAGTRRIVAFVTPEGVWAYGPHGLELCDVVCDAWGGEHDLALGVPAAA